MVFFELWCPRCNEVHAPNSVTNVTTLTTIIPGKEVWVRRNYLKKVPGVSDPTSLQSPSELPTVNPASENIVKPSSSRKVKPSNSKAKNGTFGDEIDPSEWDLVPVLGRCSNLITVQCDGDYLIVDLDLPGSCMPSNEHIVPDLTELHYSHQPAILHNLKVRAFAKQPYTFIGNVLVSINPLQECDDNLIDKGAPHPKSMAENAFQRMAFAATQRFRLEDRARRQGTVQEGHVKNTMPPQLKNGLIMDRESPFAKQYGMINQSIVISGESGSGKTEAAKRVLKQLVDREGYAIDYYADDDPNSFDFQEALIGANPLLEAFGNAATVRNHNSSRFGKFLQLRYEPAVDHPLLKGLGSGSDSEPSNASPSPHAGNLDYFLYGAKIVTYLLERSRVTFQDPKEKNYKVFYQVLTTPNWKLIEELGFFRAGYKFTYLTEDFVKEHHDRDGYLALRTSIDMSKINAKPTDIFQIVGAILHLGNIDFEAIPSKEGDIAKVTEEYINAMAPPPPPPTGLMLSKNTRRRFSSNASGNSKKMTMSKMTRKLGFGRGRKISALSAVSRDKRGTQRTSFTKLSSIAVSNPENRKLYGYSALDFACKLLEVNDKQLKRVLTSREIKTKSETWTKSLTVAEAIQRRDAVAKHMYALLFDWMVDRLNQNLEGEPDPENENRVAFIGILDLFGFEVFDPEVTSLGTMLINWSNESALEIFAQNVLIAESELYKSEEIVLHEGILDGVEKATVRYKEVLELFEGRFDKKRFIPGLISVIDAQSSLKSSTDETLLAELKSNFADSSCFLPVHPTKRNQYFKIKHYACEVEYNIHNFLLKNDQSVPNEIESLFFASKNKIIRKFPFVTGKRGISRAEKARTMNARRQTKNILTRAKRQVGGEALIPGPRQSVLLNKGKKRDQKPQTVCGTFLKQMKQLREVLQATDCSYIRCVKPNPTLYFNSSAFDIQREEDLIKRGPLVDERADHSINVSVQKLKVMNNHNEAKRVGFVTKSLQKGQRYFETDYVSAQLKALGVYECVNVLKSGLPTRIPYARFVEPYADLFEFREISFYSLYDENIRFRHLAAAIMIIFDVNPTSYRLGKTRVFFSNGELDVVKQTIAEGIHLGGGSNPKGANRMKKRLRNFLAKRILRVFLIKMNAVGYFLKRFRLNKAARTIQRAARVYLKWRHFEEKNNRNKAATSIQKMIKGYIARKKFVVIIAAHRAVKRKADEDAKKAALTADTQSVGTSVHDALRRRGTEGTRMTKFTLDSKYFLKTFKLNPETGNNAGKISTINKALHGRLDNVNLEAQPVKHDAMRGPLMSYFNRRSTYNRKHLTLSTMLNEEERLKISEVTSNSPPSGLNFGDPNDERWESGEVELLLMNFEGDKADRSLNPLRHDFDDSERDDALMAGDEEEDEEEEDEDEDEDEGNSEEEGESNSGGLEKDHIEIDASDSEDSDAVGSFLLSKNTRKYNEVSLMNDPKPSDMFSDEQSTLMPVKRFEGKRKRTRKLDIFVDHSSNVGSHGGKNTITTMVTSKHGRQSHRQSSPKTKRGKKKSDAIADHLKTRQPSSTQKPKQKLKIQATQVKRKSQSLILDEEPKPFINKLNPKKENGNFYKHAERKKTLQKKIPEWMEKRKNLRQVGAGIGIGLPAVAGTERKYIASAAVISDDVVVAQVGGQKNYVDNVVTRFGSVSRTGRKATVRGTGAAVFNAFRGKPPARATSDLEPPSV